MRKVFHTIICLMLVGTTTPEAKSASERELGLRCNGEAYRAPLAADSTCLMHGGGPAVPSVGYRRLADGRWQSVTTDGVPAQPPIFLAAGSLELVSSIVRGERKAAMPKVVVQSPALDGLTSASKIEWQGGPWQGISLKDKRVAVVLSSQSIEELERFRRERKALLDATAGIQNERVQETRKKLVAVSDPDRLLTIVAKVFRKYAREVVPVDDFTAVKKGRFDYILLVHWKSYTRFDLLNGYETFPEGDFSDWAAGRVPAVAGSWLSGMLITPDLKAVELYSPDRPYVYIKNSVIRASNKKHKRDRAEDAWTYLIMLATCFGIDWGEGPDDLGGTGRSLEFEMKGFR